MSTKPLAVLSVAALVSSAYAQRYRIVETGVTGTFGQPVPTAINNGNEIVGWNSGVFGDFAFAWVGGVLHDFSGQGYGSSAMSVNNFGEFVGTDDVNGNDSGSVAWIDFTPYFLKVDGAGGANGINDSGQIVGTFFYDGANDTHAYLYYGGTLTDIGAILGDQNSSAAAINSSGQIAGSASNFGFIYDHGIVKRLGTLAGGTSSYPSAINASGKVVGTAVFVDGSTHAFIYSNGAMTDLGNLGATVTNAYGINNSGTVVGTTETTSGASVGYVWSNGVMTNLNSLCDGGVNSQPILSANAINDRGYIAGTQLNAGLVLLAPYLVDAPDAYDVTAGKHISGNLSSLARQDFDYFVVQAGPYVKSGPEVSIDLVGTSTNGDSTDVRMQVYGHVNSENIEEAVQLYDYVGQQWVLCGSHMATTFNSLLTVVGADAGRFVQSGTNQMKARLTWTQLGPVSKSPWSVYIDQAVWNVSP